MNTSSKNCVFCKIIEGEIPAFKLYEDDKILAFLDVGPLSEGHTLVIPKGHFEKLHCCTPEYLTAIASRLGIIAKAVMKAVNCEGYNVLCNNSRAAGQAVDHVHFHIIPRNTGDGVFTEWKSSNYAQGKAALVAEKIKENLKNP